MLKLRFSPVAGILFVESRGCCGSGFYHDGFSPVAGILFVESFLEPGTTTRDNNKVSVPLPGFYLLKDAGKCNERAGD